MYVPIGGKKLLTFMDDFNMPAKDTFGSQPPLELMKLWLDYGFWYDREKQTQKYIKVSHPLIPILPSISCYSCFTSLPYNRHISPAFEFSPYSKPDIYCHFWALDFLLFLFDVHCIYISWTLYLSPLILFMLVVKCIYVWLSNCFPLVLFYCTCTWLLGINISE